MSDASRAAKQKTGTINAAIESGLSGVRTTKAFANEAEQQQRFDEANEVFKTAKRGFHKEMGRFNAVMEFCTGILPVAVIAVGGWLIMRGRMDYVDLITFSLYVTAFVSPIRKLANFAEMFSNGFAGLHRFIELMATEPSIQDAPDAQPLEHVQGRVDVNDVSFAYGEKAEVLHNVTLHIPAGETVALVGRSGCGKSTLSKALLRLIESDGGSICLDGRDVTHAMGAERRAVYRTIQMVFQNPVGSFDPRRTLGDGIGESLRNAGVGADECRRRVAVLLERCGLPANFALRYPSQVSGGQCQRAAIARALSVEPRVLVCDEATSSLDVTVQKQIIELLQQLQKEKNLAYLFICHNLALVQQFCDKVIVLYDGKIVEYGLPDEVILHPQSEYAKRLVDAIF